jgi:hypothetical protein
MNDEFDFNNLPPAEIEARCRQIETRINALEDESRRQENVLQETRAGWRQYRQQSQQLLEQLVVVLLPDLSEPVKFRLSQFFPNHPELFRDPPPVQSQKDFWQDISAFFSNLFDAAPNRLEETRVLLRNVLWQLEQVPPRAGELTELFQAFLDAKNKYFAQDRMMNRQEAQANQTVERINELSKQLRRCRDLIGRRRPDEDRKDDDSLFYNQSSSYRPPPKTDIDAAFTDSSRFNSSSDAAKADFEAVVDSGSQNVDSTDDTSFSGFGGGGDFAGGGAGGSWENYS